MAHNHPLSTPFATTGDGDGLEDALVQRIALVYDDAADIQALDLTGKSTLALILGRDVFAYDMSDTVTAHDGTTCLVTLDGKRFKNDGTRVAGSAVASVDNDTTVSPPASPATGDAYLLPDAPTGAWAAYAKHIAVYSEGAWTYAAPRRGMLVYIAGSNTYRYYDATSWQEGLPLATIADGSLKASKLEQAYGWRAESETATPPGSIPAVGTLYLVGASATGAWAGEDGNIARSTGTAWEFVTAVEGMTVFNKAIGYSVSYKSGVWQRDLSAGIIVYRGDRVDMASAAGVTNLTTQTLLTIGSRSLLNASNRIVVRASIEDFFGANGDAIFGLYVDSETTPRDTVTSRSSGTFSLNVSTEFEFDPGDAASRTYHLKVNNQSGGTLTVNRASAVLMEVTA